VAKIWNFNIKSYFSTVKIKLLITLASAVLFVVFLGIDLKAGNNSTMDKWMSFGMGLTAPIFLSGAIASVLFYRKQKVAQPDSK